MRHTAVSVRSLPFIRHCGWVAAVVALGATLLSACSFTSATGTHLAAQQVMTFAMVPYNPPAQPTVVPNIILDPAFEADAYSQQVLNMIQVQLLTFDNNLNIIGDGAKSWKASDGGKTWTFTLQDHLKWSDGSPMAAQDFTAGILHQLDPAACNTQTPYNDATAVAASCNSNAAFYSAIVGANDYVNGKTPASQGISGIQTPDDKTIIFHLTDAISYFPDQMATQASIPLERSVFTKYGYSYYLHFNEGVAQSGPFMISGWSDPANPSVTDAQHATVLHFVRNPNWWGKAPTLTAIDMPLYGTLDGAYQDYVAGHSITGHPLDFVTVPSHEYPFARDLPDFHQVQTLAIDYFGLDWVDAPFSTMKVRQAFDLALNKQLLVDTIFQGARTPTNHVIPQGIAGHNDTLHNPPDVSGSPALTGDQSTAIQLIQQVAQSCVEKYDTDLCPYIVGNKPVTSSTKKAINPNCPDFPVGVTSGDKPQSTQKEIDVWVSPANSDRVRMAQAAAAVWSTALCLNVVAKADGSFGKEITSNIGKPTKAAIWTQGWLDDYPDAQDFTTNLFDPTSPYDTTSFGFPTGTNATIIASMHAADHEPDPAKRTADLAQIEQQLVNVVAWIPYAQPKYLYRFHTQIQGLVVPVTQVIADQSWSNIFIQG